MEKMNKVTKREILTVVADYFANDGRFFKTENEDITAEDIVAYANTTIAQLDKKAAKAKETAAEKRANDPLLETVAKFLTDDLRSIDEITNLVIEDTGDDSITRAKVQNRLSKLTKSGDATKEKMKVEKDGNKREIMGYKAC